MNKTLKSIIKTLIAIIAGSVLFIVFTTVQIPVKVIPDTYLEFRIVVLSFFASVFGPVAGLAIGIIGHSLGDIIFYGNVWWSWVLSDGLFGLLIGCFSKFYEIDEGHFNYQKVIIFNIVQSVSNVACWIVAAPLLDIAMYEEPSHKVFAQGVAAFVGNIIVVAVLGSLVNFAYSKIRLNMLNEKQISESSVD